MKKTPMLFEYEGSQYVLEFEREALPPWEEKNIPQSFKEVVVGGKRKPATKLFTTARLWRLTPTPVDNGNQIVAFASAGCHHKDKFVKEIGRQAALKHLYKVLKNEPLIKAVSKCYNSRKQVQPVDSTDTKLLD